MQARLLTNISQLMEVLHTSWNALLNQGPDDTIFLTAQWIESWLNVQTKPINLLTIVVESDGEIIAIAPFYIDRIQLLKQIPLRTLRVIGDTQSGGEYPGLLTKSAPCDSIYKIIADTLQAHKHRWDCMWLPRCGPQGVSMKKFVNECNIQGFRSRVREHEFSAFPLPESYDEYLKGFSRNHRNRLRRIEKKFDAIDGINIETCSDTSQIEGNLKTLFELHALRWQAIGDDGAFARRPLMQQFYQHFCPQALDNGWLKIFLVKQHQTPVAIQLGYLYNNHYLQMQEGFLPDFEKGVGNYLRLKMIQQLIAEGIEYYDFLGGYGEHKKRWQGERLLGFDAFIWHNNWKGRLLSAKSIWPTGRLFSLEK